jgi:hypothetical protein
MQSTVSNGAAAGGSADSADASGGSEDAHSLHGQCLPASPEPSDPVKESEEAEKCLQEEENCIEFQVGHPVKIPDLLKEKLRKTEEKLRDLNRTIETTMLQKNCEKHQIEKSKAAIIENLWNKNETIRKTAEREIEQNNAEIEQLTAQCKKDLEQWKNRWERDAGLLEACTEKMEVCKNARDAVWNLINSEKGKLSQGSTDSQHLPEDDRDAGMDPRVVKGICPQCSLPVYSTDVRGIDKTGRYCHDKCMQGLGKRPSLNEKGEHQTLTKKCKQP